MTAAFETQKDKLLYPEVFWNRPTNIGRAGRLLIIGGHQHGFNSVQNAYKIAHAAGIGSVQAAMPDSLRKIVGITEFGIFLPSTKSGSIGRSALSEILSYALDFDTILIGPNLTANAETAVLAESLVSQLNMPIVITEETITALGHRPDLITSNPNLLVACGMSGVLNIVNRLKIPIKIQPNGGLIAKIELVSRLASASRCHFFIGDQDIIVASQNKISFTPVDQQHNEMQSTIAAIGATFWTQNQTKPYQSLTSAAYVLQAAAVSQSNDSIKNTAKSIANAINSLEN